LHRRKPYNKALNYGNHYRERIDIRRYNH
jgi:hypothetical protein